MKVTLATVAATAMTSIACATSFSTLITSEDAHRLSASIEGVASKPLSVVYEPCDGIMLRGTFEITSKGNGTLEMGGLSVRVFDGHDDGESFDGGLLNVLASDFDGDGCEDVVVNGTALISDERAGVVVSRQPVRAVFLFDRQSGELREHITSPHVPAVAAQQAVQGDGPASGGSTP